MRISLARHVTRQFWLHVEGIRWPTSLSRGYAGTHSEGGASGQNQSKERHGGDGENGKIVEVVENVEAGEVASERGQQTLPKEVGNKPKGPEPTRYGDWERAGRCSDF